ncbi:MAG: hypothetical protein F2911_00845 [Actinobacteria bacterium]|nr:hypothetical protein [Actinomycetota bacterium]MSW36767.1 hypothetical protein [Actinomycetota bacterium]
MEIIALVLSGLALVPAGVGGLLHDGIDVADEYFFQQRGSVRLELIDDLGEGTDVRVEKELPPRPVARA